MNTTIDSIITQQQHRQVNLLSDPKKKKFSRQPKSSALPDVIKLSLRGVSMTITRDKLLSLPESILMVMFPQGHVTFEDDICHVNFDYQALAYILYKLQCFNYEHSKERVVTYSSITLVNDPLFFKQGMIILCEELECFIVAIASKPTLTNLKKKCTQTMIKQDQIFDSFVESIALKTTSGSLPDALNVEAEHQLMDLLCQAGFTKQDRWGHRWMEPNKTCISSLSVAPIQYHNRVFVGQKLMMFWRKPARKCWWSKSIVEVNGDPVKLWCRRTWTLEFMLL